MSSSNEKKEVEVAVKSDQKEIESSNDNKSLVDDSANENVDEIASGANASPVGKKMELTSSSDDQKISKTKELPEGKGTKAKSEEKYTFFYGNKSPFSQFHPCKFIIDGTSYSCAEQYMMHQKAVTFKDKKMASEILKTSCPKTMKKCGRKVKNFDKAIWGEKSKEVVKRGSVAKFSQNPELKAALLATAGTILVEASPRDRLWGIGMGASNPKAKNKANWRGKNLLGYILTEVRDSLMQQEKD